jgi:hypothetical protein
MKKQYVNKYHSSGIYKPTCKGCDNVYIGQTGCSFPTHYVEHIRVIRYNSDKSIYAEHILDE